MEAFSCLKCHHQYSPFKLFSHWLEMCTEFELQVCSVTFTHCELRQTVHAVLLVAGCDWGLLGRRFTVQVVVGQGLHRTHPFPYPSLHLMLVDGQIQVLSLEAKDATWRRAWLVCNIYYACVVFLQLLSFLWGHFLNTVRSRVGLIHGTHLDGDDAARFVVVRFAGVVPVQRVELRVGLIAEGFTPHRAEVEMEAVHQEVNFDPGPPGLWTHRRSGTWDEGGAVHYAARLVLEEWTETMKWFTEI